jgi:hypothetical protein
MSDDSTKTVDWNDEDQALDAFALRKYDARQKDTAAVANWVPSDAIAWLNEHHSWSFTQRPRKGSAASHALGLVNAAVIDQIGHSRAPDEQLTTDLTEGGMPPEYAQPMVEVMRAWWTRSVRMGPQVEHKMRKYADTDLVNRRRLFENATRRKAPPTTTTSSRTHLNKIIGLALAAFGALVLLTTILNNTPGTGSPSTNLQPTSPALATSPTDPAHPSTSPTVVPTLTPTPAVISAAETSCTVGFTGETTTVTVTRAADSPVSPLDCQDFARTFQESMTGPPISTSAVDEPSGRQVICQFSDDQNRLTFAVRDAQSSSAAQALCASMARTGPWLRPAPTPNSTTGATSCTTGFVGHNTTLTIMIAPDSPMPKVTCAQLADVLQQIGTEHDQAPVKTFVVAAKPQANPVACHFTDVPNHVMWTVRDVQVDATDIAMCDDIQRKGLMRRDS